MEGDPWSSRGAGPEGGEMGVDLLESRTIASTFLLQFSDHILRELIWCECLHFFIERQSTGTDGARGNAAAGRPIKLPCRLENKAAPSVVLLRLVLLGLFHGGQVTPL